MSGASYKQSIEKRKQKQVQAIWQSVQAHQGLQSILKLREKIKDVQKKRQKTHELIKTTEGNFEGLKKNIKEFTKSQNTGKKNKR